MSKVNAIATSFEFNHSDNNCNVSRMTMCASFDGEITEFNVIVDGEISDAVMKDLKIKDLENLRDMFAKAVEKAEEYTKLVREANNV